MSSIHISAITLDEIRKLKTIYTINQRLEVEVKRFIESGCDIENVKPGQKPSYWEENLAVLHESPVHNRFDNREPRSLYIDYF